MPPVVIYTKPSCPYCVRAQALLQRKGVAYEEIVASVDPEMREEMIRRSGRMTYPQIFIGEQHVGGCDDLHELERRGELDRLLAA
ncbi:glutaredoxin 3 [Caulobacter sp. 17J80-11]|uniref:glutaredoxin 3 n=1 Tax=Caulobacter sp. 17J80-11 TaxID=2763502 RepID=UPI001653A3E6|nr:glutaredoxin 3 [Caulobacter sp. 17J80-11]